MCCYTAACVNAQGGSEFERNQHRDRRRRERCEKASGETRPTGLAAQASRGARASDLRGGQTHAGATLPGGSSRERIGDGKPGRSAGGDLNAASTAGFLSALGNRATVPPREILSATAVAETGLGAHTQSDYHRLGVSRIMRGITRISTARGTFARDPPEPT